MAKVDVIVRFAAHEGRERQLRALFHGMLTPTRAESICELCEFYDKAQPELANVFLTAHPQFSTS
jgi:quinol monooxygenase YgiN